ncbi:MAG: ankyrin repeat domain-containing protein [Bacteroidota bacterium]
MKIKILLISIMILSLFSCKKYKSITCEDFHQLVAQNNISEVTYHLKNNFNAECEINAGVTPIMTASLYNNTEIINLLLKYKVNINKQTQSGWTALIYASKEGNYETVKLLLDNKANPDLYLKGGENAFIEACSAQQEKVSLLLLERGIDVNTVKNEIGLNGLIVASYFGNLELVKKTLEKTDDINHKNIYGETALMRASMTGNKKVVEFLLEKGANKLIKDKLNNDALFYSKKFEHPEVYKILN